MKKKQNKINILIETIGVALITSVVFFIIISAMLQNKFVEVYERGVKEGERHCFQFIKNNITSQQTRISINYSFNVSTKFAQQSS